MVMTEESKQSKSQNILLKKSGAKLSPGLKKILKEKEVQGFFLFVRRYELRERAHALLSRHLEAPTVQ